MNDTISLHLLIGAKTFEMSSAKTNVEIAGHSCLKVTVNVPTDGSWMEVVDLFSAILLAISLGT